MTQYTFALFSYRHGEFLKNITEQYETEKEARERGQQIADTAEDEYKIVLLFRQYDSYDDGIKLTRHVLVPISMYWPVGIMQTLQTFFEVL